MGGRNYKSDMPDFRHCKNCKSLIVGTNFCSVNCENEFERNQAFYEKEKKKIDKAKENLDKIYELLAADMEKKQIGSGRMLLKIYKECRDNGREFPVYNKAVDSLIEREGVHYVMGGSGIIRLRFSDMVIVDGYFAFYDVKALNREIQSLFVEEKKEEKPVRKTLFSAVKGFFK